MPIPTVPHRHQKQMRFLAALAQGRTPAEAAGLADVPLPTFYTWRTKHTRFREAWKRAVRYAETPPFPRMAELAALRLTPPKTHWGLIPGGMLSEDAWEPGDRVAMISQVPESRRDTIIYYTVMPGGEWFENCRAPADSAPPFGIEHPEGPLPPEVAARLPPRRPPSEEVSGK